MASLGMIAGVGITFDYMIRNQPWLREVCLGIPQSAPITSLWWDIQPISAGVFGVPLGFAVIGVVSLLTREPSEKTQALVETLRYPDLRRS